MRLIPSTFQLMPKGFWRSFFSEEQFFRQQVEMINLVKFITMQCSTTQSCFFPFLPVILSSLPSTLKFQPFHFPNVFLSTIHIHLPLSYPILSHPNLLPSPAFSSGLLSGGSSGTGSGGQRNNSHFSFPLPLPGQSYANPSSAPRRKKRSLFNRHPFQ